MKHLITCQFELVTPSETFPEGMAMAHVKAREILCDLSREAGRPIELVRIDPMPKEDGIKLPNVGII